MQCTRFQCCCKLRCTYVVDTSRSVFITVCIFWSDFSSKTSTIVHDTVVLLMNEYGFSSDSICKLDADFWSYIKEPGNFAIFRDEIATKRLPIHVNKHIRGLNRDRALGMGATKCKFMRPVVEHEKVVAPTATKQTSISGFFKPKAGPSNE